MSHNTRRGDGEVAVTIILVFVAIFLLIGGMVGCPSYNVYLSEKSGQGQLAEADSTRRVAVLEAQAKLDSAKLLAGAEIERAKGVAEANRIIGESLHGNEAYLRYLWIHSIQDSKNQIIYVPTEAQLPILEAGRRNPAEAR